MERLIPGVGVIVEVEAAEHLIPGGPLISETPEQQQPQVTIIT